MKHFFQFSLLAFFISVVLVAPVAHATVPPALQLSATGTGDQVQVSVTGDPDQSVLLSYTKAGAGPTIVALGTTNGNGSFTSTVSSATYGLASGTLVTALIGGTNGLKSPTIAWPTVLATNSFTLSQNALVLSAGLSATITANNTSGTALYVSNNSNPSIANVNISGTQASITGNTAGSTTVTLCLVGTTSNCPTVSVVVLSAGSGQLTFSQSSVTVVTGQNLPVTISGGNGAYTIRNNTAASIIQASISGAVLTLSTGASTGSSSITVCSTDNASCGVVVATAGDASTAAVTFSNSAPVTSVNSSTTVHIYGPSGVQLYVSSNSSPSTIQANLSGTTLTLTGIAAGTSNVSVCASTNTCATLTVTVQNAVASGSIALSQNTLSVQVGQNGTVTISGGTQPYTVVGGTSSVSQQTVSGNTLTVYGVAAGTSNVQVCSAGGACVLLIVTVNGSGTSASSVFPQSTLTLMVGQSSSVALVGGTAYYLSGNSNSAVASTSVSGSTTYVSGLAPGTTNITVCQSGGACGTLVVTVSTAPVTTSQLVVAPPVVTTPAHLFTEYLSRGKTGTEVLALQKLLVSLGLLSATPNGYFGLQTTSAVIAFQKAHGIQQLGVVGPSTRAALNAAQVTTSTSGSTGAISTMSLTQLQALVQTLESQLTEAQNRIAALQGH